MNVVFIVPTGIGAEIGGHSGDATPAAKLVASVCDVLFIHPNVVNASDLNEMTENMLYVEGSVLDRFLEGQIGLESVYSNKLLLIANKVTPQIVNAVSGARATIGAEIVVVELKTPIRMVPFMVNGKASGDIYGIEEALRQIVEYSFDVLVVNTPIEIDDRTVLEYLSSVGGTNPWGGVEAKLSKLMSEKLNKPVIHSPVENSKVLKAYNEVVDPRKAAELVSICYLHCCLRGGHVAPKISLADDAYWNRDIDFMVSPVGVFGRPHIACVDAGIPIIYVGENRTVLSNAVPNASIRVENYLEAVGVVCAKRAGVSVSSVRRPLRATKVIGSKYGNSG